MSFEDNSFAAIVATYSLFHVPAEDKIKLLENAYRWLRPRGKLLFIYATKEYTGKSKFHGYREFMGRQLYYSHTTAERLYIELSRIGFIRETTDYRTIGNETLLWITVAKQEVNQHNSTDS